MRFRKPKVVSVNGGDFDNRLLRFSTDDLFESTEASIMLAGRALSQARTNPEGVGLDECLRQLSLAEETLKAMIYRRTP